MAKARSSGLPDQVRTLFGAGVAGGLSDAELLDRFLSLAVQKMLGNNSDVKTTKVGATKWLNSESINPRF